MIIRFVLFIFIFIALGCTTEGELADSLSIGSSSSDILQPNAPGTTSVSSSFHSSVTSSPLISWITPTDPTPTSGLNRMEVAISTSPAGGNEASNWQSLDPLATTYSFPSGLALTECINYYATTRMIDNAGNISNNGVSPAFQVDITNPTPPIISRNNDFSETKTPQITIDTAGTDNCSFAQYQFALSTDLDADNVLDTSELGNSIPWENIGNLGSFQRTGLSLLSGMGYFVSIRSIDSLGNSSPRVDSTLWVIPVRANSSGWQIDAGGDSATHPIVAGNDRALIVIHGLDVCGGDSDVTSATFGGQTMTPVNQIYTTGGGGCGTREEIFLLNEAGITSAANSTIQFTYANANTKYRVTHSIMLEGVNQTAPVNNSQIASESSSSTITVNNVNEGVGSITVGAFTDGGSGTITMPAGMTTSSTTASTESGQVSQNAGYIQHKTSQTSNYNATSSNVQRFTGIMVNINP